MLILARVLVALVALATVVLALLPSPPAIAGLEADPIKHAFGIFLVTALAGLAFPRASIWLLFLVVAVASGALEVVQGIPPFTRDPDLADWIAGMIGALVGAALLAAFRLALFGIGMRSQRAEEPASDKL